MANVLRVEVRHPLRHVRRHTPRVERLALRERAVDRAARHPLEEEEEAGVPHDADQLHDVRVPQPAHRLHFAQQTHQRAFRAARDERLLDGQCGRAELRRVDDAEAADAQHALEGDGGGLHRRVPRGGAHVLSDERLAHRREGERPLLLEPVLEHGGAEVRLDREAGKLREQEAGQLHPYGVGVLVLHLVDGDHDGDHSQTVGVRDGAVAQVEIGAADDEAGGDEQAERRLARRQRLGAEPRDCEGERGDSEDHAREDGERDVRLLVVVQPPPEAEDGRVRRHGGEDHLLPGVAHVDDLEAAQSKDQHEQQDERTVRLEEVPDAQARLQLGIGEDERPRMHAHSRCSRWMHGHSARPPPGGGEGEKRWRE
mmetsp:Transcript_44151/g.107307  ORF Transcript_44151/g.107307 Transcript_44151/m.107307 type:complete len:370 (-) Transcript_44151:193-1302(-)